MTDPFFSDDERFLTASQAADLLNVSRATLKKFIVLGKIKTFKTPGGHHRIRKRDLLEALLSDNRGEDAS